MTLATLEQGCDKTAIDHLFADRRTIRDRLVRVLNNTPRHVGGPGERIAPAPPPLTERSGNKRYSLALCQRMPFSGDWTLIQL